MRAALALPILSLAVGCSTEALELEPGGYVPAVESEVPAIEIASGTPAPRTTPALAPTLPAPPVEPAPVPAPIVAVGLGRRHTCAVTKAGDLFCWGAAPRGQTGLGHTDTIGDDELPRDSSRVDVGGRFVVDVAAGHHHTCALTGTGDVLCFGVGAFGQLGNASTDDIGADASPGDATIALGGQAVQLAAGELHTCALLDDGRVRCFGAGADGRLGYGDVENIGDDESPNRVGAVDLGMDVVSIVAGERHTCALSVEGTVRCWGENDDGRLGYGFVGDVGDDESPRDVGLVPLPGLAVAISAGTSHTCAVLEDGGVACFGLNRYGELGSSSADTIGDNEAVIPRIELDAPVVAVSAGNFRTCVTFDTGAVRCWGYPFDGGLGSGRMAYAPSPRDADDVGLGTAAIEVVSGGDHSCAIVEGRHLMCWGSGEGGRLGYGSEENVGDDELPEVMGDVDLGE